MAALHRDVDIGHDAQAQMRGFEARFVSSHIAALFEPPVPPMALRGLQMNGFGQLQVRGPPVGLQMGKDAAIRGVKLFCLQHALTNSLN